MTKYTLYRDHGNNLLVLDGECNIVYPAPNVRSPCVLVHSVTTDLNNPPSETNPWLCELAGGQVALFTSDWLPPVWVSEGNTRSYQSWGGFPWVPHGETPVPVPVVRVGEKWEAWNGQTYEVIGVYADGKVGARQLGDILDCATRAEALRRKVEEAAPAAPAAPVDTDDDVYLRAEFEKRHRNLNLTRGALTNYADPAVNHRWTTWIIAIDTVRATAGKSAEHKALEHKHTDAVAALINERGTTATMVRQWQELLRDLSLALGAPCDLAKQPVPMPESLLDAVRSNVQRINGLEHQCEAQAKSICAHHDARAQLSDRNKELEAKVKELEATAATQDFSGLEARVLAFCVSGSSTDWITSIPTGRITGAQPTLAAPYGSKDFTIAQLKGEVANLRTQAEQDRSTISDLTGQVRRKSEQLEWYERRRLSRFVKSMSELLDVPLTRDAEGTIKAMLDKVKGLQATNVDLRQHQAANSLMQERLQQSNERRQKLDKALSDALGLLRGTRD